jgi:hypothetical protein
MGGVLMRRCVDVLACWYVGVLVCKSTDRYFVVLRKLGMAVSETDIKTAKLSDMIFTKWGDWPVEIFLSSSSFSNEIQ